MKKVILELGVMPTSCSECVLSGKVEGKWVCCAFNYKLYIDFNGNGRHKRCPLKEIEIVH